MILLPGLDKQLQFLLNNVDIKDKKILVIGVGAENVALKLSVDSASVVEMIIDDFESFLSTRTFLTGKDVNLKMMDYTSTDYKKDTFDIVYTQAAVYGDDKNRIYKEIKRILRTNGLLCVGEITTNTDEFPDFMSDLLENSGLSPLKEDEITEYFKERNWETIAEKGFPDALKNYYSEVRKKSKDSIESLDEDEKTYYKKLIKKINHETNSFVKNGADKYLGFMVKILKKN